MAVVTSALINALRTGFSKEFEDAKSAAPSQWVRRRNTRPVRQREQHLRLARAVPEAFRMDRQRAFKSIREYGYSVTNKLYEATVDIPRTAIEDDQIGVYAPLFREMGYAAATHPDEIVFGLLRDGKTAACYDGKMFFAKDHPVFQNVDGTARSRQPRT